MTRGEVEAGAPGTAVGHDGHSATGQAAWLDEADRAQASRRLGAPSDLATSSDVAQPTWPPWESQSGSGVAPNPESDIPPGTPSHRTRKKRHVHGKPCVRAGEPEGIRGDPKGLDVPKALLGQPLGHATGNDSPWSVKNDRRARGMVVARHSDHWRHAGDSTRQDDGYASGHLEKETRDSNVHKERDGYIRTPAERGGPGRGVGRLGSDGPRSPTAAWSEVDKNAPAKT